MILLICRLVREALEAFISDEALTRGAAIAFYALTAMAPVLFIAISIASLAFGPDAAQGAIAFQLRHFMSQESAQMVQLAIRHAPGTSKGAIGTAIGMLALIVTASGVFGEMEDALNVIWKAPPKRSIFLRLVRGRAASLGLVIGLGFLLLTSMVFTAGIAALGHYIDAHTRYNEVALALINVAISGVLMSVLFAAIYKVLPNKNLEWRDVGVAAVTTSLLFQLGQFLIGYYLGTSGVATPYGAAGGLIAVLLWVYYSAQVFLLGAELTKVYARHFGSQTEESRQ